MTNTRNNHSRLSALLCLFPVFLGPVDVFFWLSAVFFPPVPQLILLFYNLIKETCTSIAKSKKKAILYAKNKLNSIHCC